MGSLSPMRTSATSSSMSSLLQTEETVSPSRVPAPRLESPLPSAAQVLTRQVSGPGGWGPRYLGDPGCSPAPPESCLQLYPTPGRGQVGLCSVSAHTDNFPSPSSQEPNFPKDIQRATPPCPRWSPEAAQSGIWSPDSHHCPLEFPQPQG